MFYEQNSDAYSDISAIRIITIFVCVCGFMGICYLFGVVLGIITTMIIHSDHNISSGCPLSNPHNCSYNETIMCNFSTNENIWGMCTVTGYMSFVVILSMAAILNLFINIFPKMCAAKSICIPWNEIKKSDKVSIMWLGIMISFFANIGVGIGVTWIIYGRKYIYGSAHFCNLSSINNVLVSCTLVGAVYNIFIFLAILIVALIIHLLICIVQRYRMGVTQVEKININSASTTYESV